MSDAFRFETFVDVHGNIFNEYLSSVVARLSKEDEEYKALQEKIAVVPGGAFFADPQKAADCKYVRLNFSSPSLQQIDQGAEKLGRVMNSLLG